MCAVMGQLVLVGRAELVHFCCASGGRWVESGGVAKVAPHPFMLSMCLSACPSLPLPVSVVVLLMSTSEGRVGVV